MHVDGATALHVGGEEGVDIDPGSYPALRFEVVLVPNAANSLSMAVLLPPLNPVNERAYSTTEDTILTVEGLEGLEVLVTAGSMLIGGAPAPDGTPIMLNQVQHDGVPMPIPDGAAPPFAWTLQPAGATFDPPIQIKYPNMSRLPAGGTAYFLSFDHDTERFEIVSSSRVTDDGRFIVSDPGSGLTKSGWGCNCPPYSVTGACDRDGNGDSGGSENENHENQCEGGGENTPSKECEKCGKEASEAKVEGEPVYLFSGEWYDDFVDLRINLSSAAAKYATFVHELAHLYCGHLGTPNDEWWPSRTGLSHVEVEFEAESVAYILCKRLGIKTTSDMYLSSFLESQRDVPNISLERMLKAAGLIEQMGKRRLPPRKEKRVVRLR